MSTHTRKWKEKQLSEIKDLIKKYPVIAIADLTRFPATLAKDLRKKLAKDSIIKVSNTRVIIKALESSDKKDLLNYVKGSCAIIFTKKDPFELFAFVKKNKGSLPAKEGMIAENDIIVPAGDTGLPPGPALSELKAAGLKVKIEKNSIYVTEDKVLTKKDEVITKEAAAALSKLGLKPIKVGINILAVYESGIIYNKDVLDIDYKKVFEDFVGAHRNSLNLAFNISYPAKEVLPLLIGRAYKEAKAVAIESNYLCRDTADEILMKVHRQATILKEVLKV